MCKLCGCFHNSWPQTKINHERINFLPSIVITNYSRAWIYAQSNCIFITTSGFLLFEWILLSGYTPETSIFILMCSDGWIMIKVIRNLRFCIFNGMSLFIRKRTFFFDTQLIRTWKYWKWHGGLILTLWAWSLLAFNFWFSPNKLCNFVIQFSDFTLQLSNFLVLKAKTC